MRIKQTNKPVSSYAFIASDVQNCEIRAVFPTPAPPNMWTRYESTGPNERDGFDTDGDGFGDIGLFAKLLLRDLFRRNESPRFITPD